MKISIWQQFSSNHSSSFTVIGQFDSRESAEKAAAEIRSILKTIQDWYRDHEEDDDVQQWIENGDYYDEPSLVEKQLAAQYNVNWMEGIDWYSDINLDIVLDRLVFISTPPLRQSHIDGQPFDQIMERLDGKGFHYGNRHSKITGTVIFNLSFDAPDEVTAIDLREKYLGIRTLVKRVGSQLYFDRWRYTDYPIDLAFPNLIKMLQEKGCTNFQYTFQQIPVDDLDGIYTVDDSDLLIEILNSPPRIDHDHVVSVLGKLGEVRIVDFLIGVLRSTDRVVHPHYVIEALGNLEDRRAVEPLLELTKTADKWMLTDIIRALGHFNEPHVIESLITFLHDDTQWEYATNSLGLIGELALDPLHKGLISATASLQERINVAIQRAEETRTGGVLLEGLRSHNRQKQLNALEATIAAGRSEVLVAYLHNPSNRVRFEARIIDALIEMQYPQIIPFLVDKLALYGDVVINALRKIGAADALMTIAQHDRDSWHRRFALKQLVKLAEPRAFNLFIECLKNKTDVDVAADGLAVLGDAKAVPALIEAFRNARYGDLKHIEDAVIRLNGQSELFDEVLPELVDRHLYYVHVVGKLGDRRGIEPLLNLLSKAASDREKAIIQSALKRLGYSPT